MKIKKESLWLLALFSAACILIMFSFEAKEGALYGIALCEKVIIPSLLPLLIIFNLIQNCGAGRVLENILSPVTTRLFKLPKCTGAAVFFGLIGGYPTGAVLTQNLYKNNDIDARTAARLMRFNFNGGAAFIITAVGIGILQNKKSGIILFAATTISSLLIAWITSFFDKKAENTEPDYMAMPIGDALNKSVEQATRSAVSISAYIILFSAFYRITNIPECITPMIEITNGIAANYNMFSLPQLAALLSFGGLCIHLQLFSIIKNFKMKYYDFLLWRILGAAFSYGICTALLKAFPIETAVFSNYSESIIRFTSVNATLSVLMTLGCAVLIFDLENRKRKY